MLEPALMLMAVTLRKGPNLLETLHGGSVASNAMIYRHRASPRDHDRGATNNSFVSRDKPAATNNSYQGNAFSKRRKAVKFKLGYCFRFQHNNTCEDSDCTYKHVCHEFDSSNQGYRSRPQN